MTEQEQLTQQRDEAQKQLVILQAWMNVKKNIQSKFPGPHEAYKGLLKQGAANLTADDFKDYLKGQDISSLIAEQTLNEENFVKQWENWTFRFNQTQHKLQMLEEKLELLQMLDNQPTTSSFKNDINKKKQIVNQIQACDSLESLESKLSTIVQNNQKNPPQDLVQGEDLAFSAISKPAEKQSQPIELTISKIQLKDQQKVDKPPTLGADGKPVQADPVVVKTQLVESQIIYEGKMPQTKKTYLDATIARKPSRKQNQLSPIQQQITPPNLLTQKQTYIQESRGSGLANFYSPPTTKYREREEPDFKLKTQLQQNGSNKAKKMKNDLSNYISELFVQGETRSYDQPTSQRGLGGLKNMNRYFSAGKQSQAFESPNQQYSGNNVQKRVLMIRQKLQTLNTLGRQNNTYSPPSYQRAPVIDNYTPTRSSPKPRGFSQNKSPYQPGDTKRLNLDKLLQEKGQLGGSQATPQP